MMVDASATTGSGGRYMYFYWVVSSVSSANTTLLDRYLASVNPRVGLDPRRYGCSFGHA